MYKSFSKYTVNQKYSSRTLNLFCFQLVSANEEYFYQNINIHYIIFHISTNNYIYIREFNYGLLIVRKGLFKWL